MKKLQNLQDHASAPNFNYSVPVWDRVNKRKRSETITSYTLSCERHITILVDSFIIQ